MVEKKREKKDERIKNILISGFVLFILIILYKYRKEFGIADYSCGREVLTMFGPVWWIKCGFVISLLSIIFSQ